MGACTRASLVVALVMFLGCGDDPSVTIPTAPIPIFGTPQALSATVDPTTIPHTGGRVHLAGAVTVEPGAIPPLSIGVKVPGAPVFSMLAVNRSGGFEEDVFVVLAGDLVIQAGALERHFTITRAEAPQPPPPNPNPPGNPAPPPVPAPPPTVPVDGLMVRITAAPTAPKVNENFLLTATVSPLTGGDPIPDSGVTYEWLVRAGYVTTAKPVQSGGATDSLSVKLTHTGATSAGVTVTSPDSRRAYARIEFTVTP